jgi:AcrR family transcriptional regulator
MPRPLRASPDRILAAAALEFAERGYAGARVDRIARRARVNKAMLYYHFRSKEGLYRTLLRQTFRDAGEHLRAIAASDSPSREKLDRAIEAVAAFVGEHTFFPSIMLREVAEGGAHLDRETLSALAAVPSAVGAIVAQGTASRAFRDVHPLAAYFSIIVPVVVYLAGAPIRRALAAQGLLAGSELSADEFVGHIQESARRALARDATGHPALIERSGSPQKASGKARRLT